MSARRLPVTIGRDASPSPTWEAVWSDESASAYERGEAARLGEPIGYWAPSVGWLGQWAWPDGTFSTVGVHPLIVEREAGGALYRLSRDGGLTWSIADLTREELERASAEQPTSNGPVEANDGSTATSLPTAQPNATYAPTRSRGISYADGVLLVAIAAAALGFFRKRR